jgi:hypothetical protein
MGHRHLDLVGTGPQATEARTSEATEHSSRNPKSRYGYHISAEGLGSRPRKTQRLQVAFHTILWMDLPSLPRQPQQQAETGM